MVLEGRGPGCAFDDLAFVDLRAGSRIMRPKRDPGNDPTLVPVRVANFCRHSR
jgi:hypothetical protein